MACEQNILPMVFDGEPLPLDCGRKKRLFTTAQRRAMERRDGGCSFPGCDRPPSWCVGHHARQQWAHGGTTNLAEGVLICAHHHRIVHAQSWNIIFADDGIPDYIPPATVDRQRKPLRNTRYRAHAPSARARQAAQFPLARQATQFPLARKAAQFPLAREAVCGRP